MNKCSAKAACLYIACVYGFYTKQQMKKKGHKGTMKDTCCIAMLLCLNVMGTGWKDWADLQGTRLRWMASYFGSLLHRSPKGRTKPA